MDTQEKTCPYCAETIKVAAIICKHCHRDLRTNSKEPLTPSELRTRQGAQGCLLAFALLLAPLFCLPFLVFFQSGVPHDTRKNEPKSLREMVRENRKALEKAYADEQRDINEPPGVPNDGLKVSYVHRGGCMGWASIEAYKNSGRIRVYEREEDIPKRESPAACVYMNPGTHISIIKADPKHKLTLVRVNGGPHKGRQLYLPTVSIVDRNPMKIDQN